MNKIFIKHLITKPDKYILVWTYIFSRLDEENSAVIFLVELSAKYNVPKSTLKRIVSYGASVYGSIKFLETQCQKKDTKLIGIELEEKVLLAWRYILSNWEKLDDFNRGRIKLTEIDSSMLNILSKLKEKPINKKQKQRHEQISKAIDSAESTDYSGLGSGT